MSVINTNISSMQAQSSVRTSGLNLSTAMERLSSGIRINSAKDDAAGLAISTRMTASIRGISAAIRNANDGISLTQTAEGSLGQISDNLQRIRELAVQSANTGNSASDRAAMNNEASQLIAEIDRVAANTTYNGIALLDGTFQAQNLQVGAGSDTNDRIAISIDSAASTALGVGLNSNYTVGGSTSVAGALAANGLSLNAVAVGASASDGVSYSEDDASGIAIAAAINAVSGTSGVTATVGETSVAYSSVSLAGTALASAAATTFTATLAGDLVINDVSIGAVTATSAASAGVAAATHGAKIAAAINLKTAETGVTATYADATGVSLSTTDGSAISVKTVNAAGYASNTGVGAATAAGTVTTTLATSYTTAVAANAVKINGVDIGALDAAGSAAERGGQTAAAINAISSKTGVTATFDTSSGAVALAAADGRNITVTFATGVTTAITGLSGTAATSTTTRSAVTLSSSGSEGITVGDLDGSSATASGFTVGYTAATTSIGTGVSGIDLTTASSSQDALTTLDLAIDTITDSRAAMGAYQNRLTASIANLETTSMNLSASRSRILDTDYAKETTNLAKSQIIQQAATAMLAQANQSGQSVLALLK
jgi:flagellin